MTLAHVQIYLYLIVGLMPAVWITKHLYLYVNKQVKQSQLPRLAPRTDARPTLDDFGAMGAVKEAADVVLALYREEMYASDAGVEGATELHVRKNRNGTTGYVDLYFYKQWLRFEDLLDPDR